MTNCAPTPSDNLIRDAVQAWNTSIVESANDFDRMRSTLTALMPQLIEASTKPVDVVAVLSSLLSDQMLKDITTEYLSSKGENPYQVKRGGYELWEQHITAITAAMQFALRALSAEPAQHPDDTAVDNFATRMKAKLAQKREEGRSGWQGMNAEELTIILRQHVDKGDPIDVANLCMMLSENSQCIAPAEPAKGGQLKPIGFTDYFSMTAIKHGADFSEFIVSKKKSEEYIYPIYAAPTPEAEK